MKRFGQLAEVGSAVCALAMTLGSCGGSSRSENDDASVGSLSVGMTSDSTVTSGGGEESVGGDTGPKLDGPVDDSSAGCGNGDLGCTNMIDLLFVVDNSGSMAHEQLNLAKNFPLLIRNLENLKDSTGMPVSPDVQIMVTTTDTNNPSCRSYCQGQTDTACDNYVPAMGAPTTTGCNSRINFFKGLGPNAPSIPETCTTVCPADVVPSDPFIAFNATGDNVPDVVDADIDGDGQPDSPIAQTLACIGPQGINGCGYEAPLEAMLRAINPDAEWNQGSRPFLRPGSLLAIAIISDEADCTVKDYTIMSDPNYEEVDPASGMKRDSSAICWNAGVSCDGPDANGVYTNCQSIDDEKLQPTSRYTDYLVSHLRDTQHREVIMLGILGVPEVTEHNDMAPFNPIAGGEADLVYRDWRESDILAEDLNSGETPAEAALRKQFEFGIGPACTGVDAEGNYSGTGQAIANTRVMEVCHALDEPEQNKIRCCIESICDDDFSAAINCLTGIIGESIKPQG